MAVQVYPEADIMYEAQNILLQQMSPAKVVRFFASWQVGRSDYLAWRDKEFAGESVGRAIHLKRDKADNLSSVIPRETRNLLSGSRDSSFLSE